MPTPQADWYATEDETKDGLIDLYRRVAVFTDQTIEQLPLDAPGRVPWWRPGAQDVTLQRIIVHVIYDLARHAGHADNGGGDVVGEVPDPEAEWWTMSDVAAYVHVQVSTVANYRKRGQMPAPDATVGRTHMWLR
jgi:uncharacterized protein DUF664